MPIHKFKLKKPVCIIDNGKFSWVLKVDGQEILFQSSTSADYFAKHYRKLGYRIKWTASHNEE